MTCTSESAQALLLERLKERFGDTALKGESPLVFASAPGRVELAGNHTDHQGGRTISAAIDRRAYALATPNDTNELCVSMDGFGEATISLSDLKARSDERGTSASLIRGMAAAYASSGGMLRGCNMVTCSNIPPGCGLSSSAAFEMLAGVTLRAIDNPAAAHPDPVALALEGMHVEDAYFGKPTGAQDQLASAFGGVSAFDFAGEVPHVTPLAFAMDTTEYTLLLVDSHSDHSRYTDEFVAIPTDMYDIAHYLGHEKLEHIPYDEFLTRLADVRLQMGDRATLRALHYFEETRRVLAQQHALQTGDFEEFLTHVRLSGASSAQFLQSVSPHSDATGAEQPAMVILALCAHLLHDRGAYRIHGGGFGGSILAFVPRNEADSFSASMDSLLGYDACLRVSTSDRGACAERIA